MTDDFDNWASYYDIIYKSKYENGQDYRFYNSLLSKFNGRALEIACGSGRIYLEALSDGFEIDGVDISERMLMLLKQRAKERNLEPTVYNQDVTDLSIDKKYSLIYFPFSAISHIRGVKNQKEAINRIYEHLEEGGKFAFDMPVPSLNFEDSHKEIKREKVEYEGTNYTTEFWNEIEDEVHQEHLFHQRVIKEEDNKIEFETTFELSLIPKEQLEILLVESGFSEYRFYDGFNQTPLSEDTERLVVIATK